MRDNTVKSAGLAKTSNLANLLALTLRQAMGSIDIALLRKNDGFDISDVKVFMKPMGQVGTVGGVNSVETLYSAFPAFLYLNPDLVGYLLTPLLEYQESGAYTLPYAPQNLGNSYPVATGNNSAHGFGVEGVLPIDKCASR